MYPSIWTGMYGDLSLPEALRMLSACGWQQFEISTEHLVSIETADDPASIIDETRLIIHEYSLSTPQAHALLHANVAAADKQAREHDIQRLMGHIELASRFGVKTVVMHPGGYDPVLRSGIDENLKLNVSAFRRLGDVAVGHGIQIGIENLPYPGIANATDMLRFLRAIDHPALAVNLDTSHANMCSLDSAEMVCQLGDRLISTHISDNDGSGDQHLIPGGGSIDWLSLMDAFRSIDYKGNINLEIPGERHRIPELQRLKTCFALEVAECLIDLVNEGEPDPTL